MYPGLVIFSGSSEIFILGSSSPFLYEATSLYTPPNDGESEEVINFVPTPHEFIGELDDFSSDMVCSSKSLEAVILTFPKPDFFNNFLHSLDK